MAQQPSKPAPELKYYVKELETTLKEKLGNRQTGTFIGGEKGRNRKKSLHIFMQAQE